MFTTFLHHINKFLFLLFFSIVTSSLLAQPPAFTANDQVVTYDAPFQFGSNMGYYPGWTDGQLGDLARGNASLNIPGIGATALRPGLFEHYLEQYGYSIYLPWFEHFDSLGLVDHTMFVGDPSEDHRDPTDYCPSKPWLKNMGFKNMYQPIWDNGANGTPVNDDNYYALFMYKMVTLYTPYVKFWEITNEPDLDFSDQGMGWREPGDPAGSWWDDNPDPCDCQFGAPIFHYNRMLRISYEIIKSIDPNDYVTVGGLGFPSFLDAIMRNTDNPVDGSVTPDYPLKGGAYFDVMSFHSYPHINGSLLIWDPINGITGYRRHSDAAIAGITDDLNEFKAVMHHYGYDGNTFPKKLAIMTESSIPRKKLGDYIGSEEAARNYAIKLPIELQKEGVLNFHFYDLGEKETFNNALYPFQMTGFYEKLEGTSISDIQRTNSGIAYKTVSNLLYGKTYDPTKTAEMQLPDHVDGGAFIDNNGLHTYVLWAICETDDSEMSSATYSFPTSFNLNNLLFHEWNFSLTTQQTIISPINIPLTDSPTFFIPTNQQISFNCPANINLTIPSNSLGQVVAWDPISANSSCPFGSINIEQIGGAPNGSFFPVGVSTITYLISDECGNTETCSFNIMIDLEQNVPVDCPSSDYPVNINIIGNGSVHLEFIDPAGATEVCNSETCHYCITNNTLIKLVGVPDIGETFLGWNGSGCVGDNVCWKSINWDTDITATFTQNTSAPQMELSIFSSDISCHGATDGSAQVIASGGTPNYTYLWSDGQTSAQLNNLPAGFYVVTVSDANGTTGTAAIQIEQPSSLFSFVSDQINVECSGGNDGLLSVNTIGGIPSYQYQWSNNENTNTINSLSAGTYTCTITDYNGCSTSITSIITSNNSPMPTAEFNYSINGSSVIFEDNSIGLPTSWTWDFGDGSTSNTADISHIYNSEGNYSVCLTVENDCGENTSCQNISIISPESVILELSPVNGNIGTVVQVPVQVKNFNHIISFQHSFKIPDTTKAIFVGTSNFNSTALGNNAAINFTSENVNTNWLSNNGSAINLPDETIIYYLSILIKSLPGDCLEIALDELTLPTEFIATTNGTLYQSNHLFNSAEICSTPGVVISGNIQTELGLPIQEVAIHNNNLNIGLSNVNGMFTSTPFPLGSSIDLEPHKDINYVNGVTSFDLATIQQHIVGNALLNSPYKIIAADIDGSNSISSFDLYLAQQVIVANVDTFPNNESWRFVPADFVFPDPLNPFSQPFPESIILNNVTSNINHQNFIAIKVGDVNGTALPYQFGSGSSGVTRSSEGELNIKIRKVKDSEDEFYLEFLAKDFEQISAFQFDLKFDHTKMQLLEINNELLNIVTGNKFLEDGIITFIWYNSAIEGLSLEDQDVLFRIHFRAIDKKISLQNDILLVEKITPSVAYSYLGFPKRILLSAIDDRKNNIINSSITVSQNQPNPFREKTRILFKMNRAETVQIQVLNQHGKIIFSQKEHYPIGNHLLNFHQKDFPTPGIYFYTFTTSTEYIVRKMLVH